MTRPRAYQINDPGTHHAKFSLPVVPSSPQLELTGGNYNSFLAATKTGVVGGNEEPLPARIICPAQEPFTNINPGHQFGIIMAGVNSGNVIPVTFQAVDFVTIDGSSSLTASRLVTRINITLLAHGVSYPAASNNDGYFNLISVIGSAVNTGPLAFVTLVETGFTPGTLQRLGFGAVTSVTASGSGPTLGIITKSKDGRGGYFPLRYSNGESVLTQTSELISLEGSSKLRMWPNVVGGQSIYGRLTHTSTPSAILSFLTNGYTPPTCISNGGDFTSLSAGDTLGIQISLNDPLYNDSLSISFQVNFNFPINNVTDVVNAINSAWWVSSGSGRAVAITSIPEPYILDGGDILTFVIGLITVNLNFFDISGRVQSMTAKGLVDAINSAWNVAGGFGSIANVQVLAGRNHVKISSPTIDGEDSSISFITNRSAVNKIGFPFGTVRGSNIARVNGQSEIEVSIPFVDALKSVVSDMQLIFTNVLGSPISKMGLTTPISSGIRETSVTPPSWISDIITIDMLIPEAMELGDVPFDEWTTVQRFLNQDTSQQINLSNGVVNANRSITFDRFGSMPKDSVSGNIYDFLNVKCINFGGFNSNNFESPKLSLPFIFIDNTCTLLQHSMAVPSDPANAAPVTQVFRGSIHNHSDSVSSYDMTWNAHFENDDSHYTKDIGSRVASKFEFSNLNGISLKYRTGLGAWDTWSSIFSVEFQPTGDTNASLKLSGDGARFETPDDRMTLRDLNTGSALYNSIYLTRSNNGGQYLRLSNVDIFATDPNYSLTQSLNARYYVSVGDGSDTYGDFNGNNAIQQAIQFLDNRPGVIYVKAGTYTPTSTILINDINVVIEGVDRDSVIINNLPNSSTIFTDSATVEIKNVTIKSNTGNIYCGLECSASSIKVHNCVIQNINIYAVSGNTVKFSDTKLETFSNQKKCFTAIGNDVDFDFENCIFESSYPAGCGPVLLKASLSGLTKTNSLCFRRCEFNLATSIITAGGYLQANTGVLDLDPSGLDARPGTQGLVINKVLYEDCVISAINPNVTALRANILLHLIPTANGNDPDAETSPWADIKEISFIRTDFRWNPRLSPTVNPFSIAMNDSNVVSTSVVIRDCVLNKNYSVPFTDSGIHGSSTPDMAYSFNDITDVYWGLFSISANNVTIDNMIFERLVFASTTGDLKIHFHQSMNLNNITFTNYDTTGTYGPAPANRVILSSSTAGSAGYYGVEHGSVKNISFDGKTVSRDKRWCTSLINSKCKYISFDNINVVNFSTNNETMLYALRCTDSLTLKVSNFQVIRTKTNYGIRIQPDTDSNTSVSNCVMHGLSGFGFDTGILAFLPDDSIEKLMINNNTITNTLTNSINVQYYNNTQNIHITNNHLKATTGQEIYISHKTLSPNNSVPKCWVTGNVCDGIGHIRVNIRSGGSTAGLLSPSTRVGNDNWFYGLETGVLTGTSGNYIPTYYYTNNIPMVCNLAVLKTP